METPEARPHPTFLYHLDRFVGWLKRPFARKPAFFMHQLIWLLFAVDLGRSVWFELWRNIRFFTGTIPQEIRFEYNAFHFLNTIPALALTAFLVFQLFRFLKGTKTSWTSFFAITLVNLGFMMASQMSMFFQHINPELQPLLGYEPWWKPVVYALPWILYEVLKLYLVTRKHMIVLHSVGRRQFIIGSAAAVIWLIMLPTIQLILGYIFITVG